MQADDPERVSAEIAASLHGSFQHVADLATISAAVDLELGRYGHAPVMDFVAVLVERAVRARLRELEVH